MHTMIGVVGSGEMADTTVIRTARELGGAIAKEGWVLVNGGRAAGVMEASAEGAKAAGGLVVGILPDETTRAASKHLDIAICTGMGDGRNYVNVLSSDVVVALQGGAGTLSEIALALKAGRTVVALNFPLGQPFQRFERTGRLKYVETVEETIAGVKQVLAAARARG